MLAAVLIKVHDDLDLSKAKADVRIKAGDKVIYRTHMKLRHLPERKKGKWVGIQYDGYADGYPVYDVWECSVCGYAFEDDEEPTYKYCPDCGADMRTESEEA